MALLGMHTSIQHNLSQYVLYNNSYNFLIPVRGMFRFGVGVDVNKTQSNWYNISLFILGRSCIPSSHNPTALQSLAPTLIKHLPVTF